MSRNEITFKKKAISWCVQLAVSVSVGTSTCAYAQEIDELEMLDEIEVKGDIIYRDRTPSIAPQLEYGLDFFQQYEPTSVGDMIKRTPGVTFASDIAEYDAPQMRGLGAGYTQVLVNGRPIPGSDLERRVFVDRIPAEMVDRIQIIRSPTADQDSQGIGGTINIILKDGSNLDGGGVRVGGMTADGEFRSNLGVAYGGHSEEITWSINAAWQERYVPKVKTEKERTLANVQTYDELESDIRDSDDLTLGSSLRFQLNPTSSLTFDANFLSTDRQENQIEQPFDIEDGVAIADGVSWGDVDIKETSTNVGLLYINKLSTSTTWDISLRSILLERTEDTLVFEADALTDPRDLQELEYLNVEDNNLQLDTSLTFAYSDTLELKTGIDLSQKERTDSVALYEAEDGVRGDLDGPIQAYEIIEDRADAYLSGKFSLSDKGYLQLGVRAESTDREITNALVSTNNSATNVNPSAHLSYDLGKAYTFRMSVAQTLRAPNFLELSPIALADEPNDDDITLGNPALEDEKALGLDVGFERILAKGGILGVNVFYRQIEDVIEPTAVNINPLDPDDGLLFSYANSGEGDVWGIEFDLSVPLTDSLGLFANVSFMDSEIEDPFSGQTRQFLGQADYVYNIGFAQRLPSIDASFGFSYQERGDSKHMEIDKDTTLSYGGNLEFFAEKHFGEDYVLRLTANNILDATQKEHFDVYSGDTSNEMIAARRAGDLDSYKEEAEEAEPMVMLTLRKSF